MKPIDSGRITRTYTQRIEAPPDRVFSLLCPVREAEWLDGWAEGLEVTHSASGLAEDGCVFRTRMPDRPETVWMVTRHDPGERIVEFVRVTGGLVGHAARDPRRAGGGRRELGPHPLHVHAAQRARRRAG